ncbi:C-type lectin mannose-binding isoform-like [Halichoeres trimaculatus]|uniref:C-type lectin mannose-binding isoform-like n=1 Tax=Halichoeres trimaculatus TaxID=147232 RepID=UPI003D9ED8AF
MLLLLFTFALGAVSPTDGQPGLQRGFCDEFWSSFNGSCYKYVASHMTWADAELHCVSMGTNLVSIHSLEEQKFVETLIKNFDPAGAWTWIGLSDIHKEGHWMWSDGSAANFLYWGGPQPDNAGGNEHCVHLYNEDELKWNDLPCAKPLAFVCESRNICP